MNLIPDAKSQKNPQTMKIIRVLETGIGSIDIFHEHEENGKVYINYGEYTLDMMTADCLLPGDVFVAATNMQGQHGGGSARFAYDKLDLPLGLGEGLAPNKRTYALPTLEFGESSGHLEKISEERLLQAFITFRDTALANPDLKFYMTKVGLGIAGWDLWTVHKCFWDAGIPFQCENVIYPIEFEMPSDSLDW